MRLNYAQQFCRDLTRLHAFLSQRDPVAAARLAWRLRQEPRALLFQPHQGQRLKAYGQGELRSVQFGPYELRYQIHGTEIFLLNLWHTRECRT